MKVPALRYLLLLLLTVLCTSSILSQTEAWVEYPSYSLWMSKQLPRTYLWKTSEGWIQFDASVPLETVQRHTGITPNRVYLTHHHRDSCRYAYEYTQAKVPVLAPKASAPWLQVVEVTKYWKSSVPQPNSAAAYFVHPGGIPDVQCTLQDNDSITLGTHQLKVQSTPGHSRDHVSFVLSEPGKPSILIAGDAVHTGGNMWTPFTTDWDHWTDMGLKPAAASVRKLQQLKPTAIFPAHGDPILTATTEALEPLAKQLEELAFLRSFERYTKQRLGNAPKYNFLVPKEQIASGGDKPWAKVSPHLFITGNTYVLVSEHDKACLMIDPWGKRSVEQFSTLKKQENLGSLEVVMISHAHFDHYDGIFELPERKSYKIWTLDRVAAPLLNPLRWRAPFLDARPSIIDKQLTDGDRTTWQEYAFRFHHFPGQSEFTMAVETQIDGKKCLFTADNFFHQDQFSGTGGWMGLNRSWPGYYKQSAQKVLDLAPDWLLAEHGGPFEFNSIDFVRRVKWAKLSEFEADKLCVNGAHRHDWNPFQSQVIPLLQKVKPGQTITLQVETENLTKQGRKYQLKLEGRGVLKDVTWSIELQPGKKHIQEIQLFLSDRLPPGRHIFTVSSLTEGKGEEADPFFVLDVE